MNENRSSIYKTLKTCLLKYEKDNELLCEKNVS